MGCCNTNGKMPEEQMLVNKLKDSISSDSVDRTRCVLGMVIKHQNNKKNIVDSIQIDLQDIVLNPLAYALWVGSLKVFKTLINEFDASPIEMEKILLSKQFTALDIICERNFTQLLLFYIPIYIQNSSQIPTNTQDQLLTIDFDGIIESAPRNIYTPVHKACELGNISILLTIFNYFKTKDFKPHVLDLEYQEETSGENCVLIACRTGNYAMLKFLHEVVKADFSKCNAKGEGPVLVLLAAGRKDQSQVFFQCLVYLVEVVGVDFRSSFEDCLLLAQDKQIVAYLEECLKRVGIEVGKKEVEEENKVLSVPMPKTEIEMKMDEDDEFFVEDYIGERDLCSVLSSIKNFESHVEPFMSVIGNNNSILK